MLMSQLVDDSPLIQKSAWDLVASLGRMFLLSSGWDSPCEKDLPKFLGVILEMYRRISPSSIALILDVKKNNNPVVGHTPSAAFLLNTETSIWDDGMEKWEGFQALVKSFQRPLVETCATLKLKNKPIKCAVHFCCFPDEKLVGVRFEFFPLSI